MSQPAQSTSVCRYWAQTGNCFNRNQCPFAHDYRATDAAPSGGGGGAGRGGGPYLPRNERICRNVLQYGFCKFENQGCEFNHDINAALKDERIEPPMSLQPEPWNEYQQYGAPPVRYPPGMQGPPGSLGAPMQGNMQQLSQHMGPQPNMGMGQVMSGAGGGPPPPTRMHSAPAYPANRAATIEFASQEFRNVSIGTNPQAVPFQSQQSQQQQQQQQSRYGSQPATPPKTSAYSSPSFGPGSPQMDPIGSPTSLQVGHSPLGASHASVPSNRAVPTNLGMSFDAVAMNQSRQPQQPQQPPQQQQQQQQQQQRHQQSPQHPSAGGGGHRQQSGLMTSAPPFNASSSSRATAWGVGLATASSPDWAQGLGIGQAVSIPPQGTQGLNIGQASVQQPLPAHAHPHHPPAFGGLPPSALLVDESQLADIPVFDAPRGQDSLANLFMAEDLRQELMHSSELMYATLDPEDPRAPDVPPAVGPYHSFYPLEENSTMRSPVLGAVVPVYKVLCSEDGQPYTLRRVDMGRPLTEFTLSVLEQWKAIQHPNVVKLKNAFVNDEFGTNSHVFVHGYHALAETLATVHQDSAPSDELMWAYVTQIVTALQTIHGMGLACRVVDATKIIVNDGYRVRLSCVGILDVVKPYTSKMLNDQQYEDLVSLGKLIICLACKSAAALLDIPRALSDIGTLYSEHLKSLVAFLLKDSTQPPTISDVVLRVAPQMCLSLQSALRFTDHLHEELHRELDNGRIARLLIKLGFINERPEYDMSPAWAETGDRYLLKLFRDFVFHQCTQDGKPNVDLGHVIQCLNKLDAGAGEKMTLMSRDEQSLLIVSYKDVKTCIENAVLDLTEGSSQGAASGLTTDAGLQTYDETGLYTGPAMPHVGLWKPPPF